MESKMITIDICIATFKRPDLLKILLDAIKKQNLPCNISARIIIIDNDKEQSANDTVKDLFAESNINYIYDVQPIKNISLTRNKALEYANSEYIIFIDDDEWPDKDWLIHLLTTSQKYNADVVFGPVIPIYPKNAPKWIIQGGFFNRKNSTTGTIKQHGATNNTLVKRTIKTNPSLKLDPEYGLTGGEDTDLFNRLYLAGAKMVWCNEAIVYESIPYNRMTVSWLLRRSLRGGQIYARIFYITTSKLKKLLWFFQRIAYITICICLLPFSLILGKARWVWVLRKIMSNLGQLSMLFIKNGYQEYK
jgi:succinoglycan biosynthesis protein ExoM